MPKRPKKTLPKEQPRNPSRGTPLTLPPITQVVGRKGIRGIAKDLVNRHGTEIATRLRDGMLSDNLRLSLKWMQFVGDRVEGRPVETHRMVNLDEGPSGAYDLSKLPKKDRETLLTLLRAARDTTEPSGE